VSRGITSHGISLNLSCDLEPFEQVTACGIEGCRVTSVELETGISPETEEAGVAFAKNLAEALELDPSAGPSAASDLTPNP
jgi:lipoyl(octanoyl) transferase